MFNFLVIKQVFFNFSVLCFFKLLYDIIMYKIKWGLFYHNNIIYLLNKIVLNVQIYIVLVSWTYYVNCTIQVLGHLLPQGVPEIRVYDSMIVRTYNYDYKLIIII